jgi:Tfp pilus assembly protein PilX
VKPRDSRTSAGMAGAQRGFLLIIAVVLIVVAALVLTVML